MFLKLMQYCLNNRLMVFSSVGILLLLGGYYGNKLAIEAFPDTTPVQVQINTAAPALGPLEIEQEITYSVETALSGLPGIKSVRSISKFGLSQVVVDFEDGTDIYRARQLISERLRLVQLSEGIEPPAMGPISTGLGEVFHYVVSSTDASRPLHEVRTLHDWILKPELRKVSGVAEINTWGGYELQYQVVVEPDKLVAQGITLNELYEALSKNNKNVGGGRIVYGGQSLLVQGLGRVSEIEHIAGMVLRAENGVPIRVRDVAEVVKGHEIRQGAVSAQGKGEAVLGLGFMLMGENSQQVAKALEAKVAEVAPFLPDDIQVEVVYNRSDLVDEVLNTVSHNLLFGALLVIITLFLILGNWRAGLCVAVAIPLAMAFAFIGMYHLSIAVSLLSLGAMDFGILIDGSVVMTDANLKGIRDAEDKKGRSLTFTEKSLVVFNSARQVLRPIAFGMGIIAVVFLPVLTLEGIEGKMFRPMAITFVLALAGALLVALFISPLLSLTFLKDSKGRSNKKRSSRESFIERQYQILLKKLLGWPRRVVGTAIICIIAAVFGALNLGGEFIPRLSEGAIVINAVRLTGVSLEESVRYNTTIEQLILDAFPDEVTAVWSRIGTAEVATDPMGTELTDIFLKLTPRDLWKRAESQQELVGQLDKVLGDLPGINLIYSQPIELRLNEMISGIRSDIAVTIRGDALDELLQISNQVQKVLATIEGAADISGEQMSGQPVMQITINREAIARHGVPAGDVLDFIAALGNRHAGAVYQGQRVFPLTLRLPDRLRHNPGALATVMVPIHGAKAIPLGELTYIKEVEGPSVINREWGRRMTRAQCNVRDRDVATFVKEAQEKIAQEVVLPEGYVISWGGQFENLERSQNRLAIVVPFALLMVLLLLRMSLGNFRDTFLIYSAVPLAAVGGIAALLLRDIPFSVSAAVGFIALSGIAVLNGLVLVSSVRYNLEKGMGITIAVQKAAVSRIRPVLATAITDMAGFIPMAISLGIGAEVQRPLATVVVGGVFTSTLLTLLVLPVLCTLFMKIHADKF
ncbi:MAG: CusA/CzcA family heavy metal efflux RND transporter [Fibrobacterales bacterium]